MPAPSLSNSRIYSSHPSALHARYDNLWTFNPSISSPNMLSHLSYNNPAPNHQLHLFPSNPYPPPPIVHKVWILDCKSCGTFLTNRGMKAVLLLRPNVSLYSSDALPVNCSAYSSNPDVLSSRTSCRQTPPPHLPPRTCECLTQTLCCHGCGGTVGYMIVIPCASCTSSITATNRATNGHRFVFHSSEVNGTERYYIPDEPGVISCEPTGTITLPPIPESSHYNYPYLYSTQRDPHLYYPQEQAQLRSRSSSPVPQLEYLLTPPLELADHFLTPSSSPSSRLLIFPGRNHPSPLESLHASHLPTPQPDLRHAISRSPPVSVPSQAAHNPASQPSSAASSAVPSLPSSSSPPLLVHPSFQYSASAEQKEQLSPRKLKSGDLLYWHHLSRTGEIPGMEEDERARGNKNNLSSVACGKPSGRLSFLR